jgi:hypothetical protein
MYDVRCPPCYNLLMTGIFYDSNKQSKNIGYMCTLHTRLVNQMVSNVEQAKRYLQLPVETICRGKFTNVCTVSCFISYF